MRNEFNLMHGGCVELMKKIPDGSVDLTVTSPPYDNLRTYNDTLEWNEEIWQRVLEGMFRVTTEGGVVVWIVSDATINGSETGTSFKQALYAKEVGFNLHDTMIWRKQTFSAVGSLKTRYAPVFEYMFIFSKGNLKTFNPIKDRKAKKERIKKGEIRQRDGSFKPMSSIGKKYGGGLSQRFNVWDVNTEMNNNVRRLHPAVFPISLATDHIISWSNEGDTILDPFMGSGTTGIACKNLNRKFIGIEKDDKYFEIAKNRIENHVPPLV